MTRSQTRSQTGGRRADRIAPLVFGGLLVLLLAGGVSTSHWMRRDAPHTPEPPSAVPDLPAPEAAPPTGEAATVQPGFEPVAPTPEPVPLDREEIERRREIAARIRALIDEGPREQPPGTFGGLLGAAEPVPIRDDAGALLGVELRDVAPGGFYERVGLGEGDLVQAINGMPLDAEDLPSELLWALSTSGRVEIDVERADGTPDRVTVPREQVIRELEALSDTP